MQRDPRSSIHPSRLLDVRSATTLVLAILALGAPAVPAAAQEPDDTQEAVDAWRATAELTFTDASGNQDLSVLTTEFVVEHDPGAVYDLQVRLRARYGSSEGERVAETYRGEVNIGFRPAGRWSPFVYSTAEHDPFKLLDLRLSSGAGAKYRLYRSDDQGEASMSLSVLHSYEALDADAPDAAGAEQLARLRLGLDGRQELRDGVTVVHTTRYEPVYDHLDDYLLSLDTTLKVLLTRRVALSVGHEFRRDSSPASPGIKRDDRLLKAGVIVEL